jgi:hypothetical protein
VDGELTVLALDSIYSHKQDLGLSVYGIAALLAGLRISFKIASNFVSRYSKSKVCVVQADQSFKCISFVFF